MDFDRELKKKVSQVEETIKKYLPKEDGVQKSLLEAMNYSFLAGGKRLRPLLMSECYRMAGGTEEVIEPFMAAQEMIHTYSLVHDDLPAMDNDLYRRGKKTTHAVYGEAMAILAEKAGIYGMIGGQAVDVEAEKRKLRLDGEKLLFIHVHKTAGLIQSSMMIGAYLAGADEKFVQDMEKAGYAIGVAFQIQDDILDITSTLEELGKPVGSDEKNDKLTYVSVYGLERSKQDVERLSNEALEILKSVSQRNEFLEELIISLITRRK